MDRAEARVGIRFVLTDLQTAIDGIREFGQTMTGIGGAGARVPNSFNPLLPASQPNPADPAFSRPGSAFGPVSPLEMVWSGPGAPMQPGQYAPAQYAPAGDSAFSIQTVQTLTIARVDNLTIADARDVRINAQNLSWGGAEAPGAPSESVKPAGGGRFRKDWNPSAPPQAQAAQFEPAQTQMAGSLTIPSVGVMEIRHVDTVNFHGSIGGGGGWSPVAGAMGQAPAGAMPGGGGVAGTGVSIYNPATHLTDAENAEASRKIVESRVQIAEAQLQAILNRVAAGRTAGGGVRFSPAQHLPEDEVAEYSRRSLEAKARIEEARARQEELEEQMDSNPFLRAMTRGGRGGMWGAVQNWAYQRLGGAAAGGAEGAAAGGMGWGNMLKGGAIAAGVMLAQGGWDIWTDQSLRGRTLTNEQRWSHMIQPFASIPIVGELFKPLQGYQERMGALHDAAQSMALGGEGVYGPNVGAVSALGNFFHNPGMNIRTQDAIELSQMVSQGIPGMGANAQMLRTYLAPLGQSWMRPETRKAGAQTINQLLQYMQQYSPSDTRWMVENPGSNLLFDQGNTGMQFLQAMAFLRGDSAMLESTARGYSLAPAEVRDRMYTPDNARVLMSDLGGLQVEHAWRGSAVEERLAMGDFYRQSAGGYARVVPYIAEAATSAGQQADVTSRRVIQLRSAMNSLGKSEQWQVQTEINKLEAQLMRERGQARSLTMQAWDTEYQGASEMYSAAESGQRAAIRIFETQGQLPNTMSRSAWATVQENINERLAAGRAWLEKYEGDPTIGESEKIKRRAEVSGLAAEATAAPFQAIQWENQQWMQYGGALTAQGQASITAAQTMGRLPGTGTDSAFALLRRSMTGQVQAAKWQLEDLRAAGAGEGQIARAMAQLRGLEAQQQALPINQAQFEYGQRMSSAQGVMGYGEAGLDRMLRFGMMPGAAMSAEFSTISGGTEQARAAAASRLQALIDAGAGPAVVDAARADLRRIENQAALLPIRRADTAYQATSTVAQGRIGLAETRLAGANITQFYGGEQQESYAAIREGLRMQLSAATTRLQELMAAGAGPGLTAPAEAEIGRLKNSIRQSVVGQFQQAFNDMRAPLEAGMGIAGSRIGAIMGTGQLEGSGLESALGMQSASLGGLRSAAGREYQAAVSRFGANSRQALEALQRYEGYDAQFQQLPLQQLQTWYQPSLRMAGATQQMSSAQTATGLYGGAGSLEMQPHLMQQVRSAETEAAIQRQLLGDMQRSGAAGPVAIREQEAVVARSDANAMQLRTGLGNVTMPVQLREQMASAQYASNVMAATPGGYGSWRGAMGQQLGAIDTQMRYMSEYARSTPLNDEARFRLNEQYRQLGLQGLGVYNELSSGWENRVISMALGMPGNFNMDGRGLSMRDSVLSGVVNPHFGSTRGNLPTFMRYAGLAQLPSMVPGQRGYDGMPGSGVFGFPGLHGELPGYEGAYPNGAPLPTPRSMHPAAPGTPRGPGESGSEQHNTIIINITLPDGTTLSHQLDAGAAVEQGLPSAMGSTMREYSLSPGSQF